MLKAKIKLKYRQFMPIGLVLIVLIGISAIIALLLRGRDFTLFHPKGQIASEQLRLMKISVLLLLEIAIPALTLLYFFAWKYRESNENTTHDSTVKHGKSLVVTIWTIPTITMLLLASVMWPATHKLAPQKQIMSNIKPITIQVIAMRWKWLFIYPDQHIATVNFIQVPVGTPLQFDLTADEIPMSSFWIPHLGGQLYAMTGHVNRLDLIADTPGDYTGRSAEINGAGFAGMQFTTRASTQQDFDVWVEGVKKSPNILDTTAYQKLLSPSENAPVTVYAKTESELYASTLIKYSGSHGQHTEHE